MFADNRITSIHFKEEEYKIFWDKPETGDIWDKGKTFAVSILLKSILYNTQIVKLMKTMKHRTKKYPINKENTWSSKL